MSTCSTSEEDGDAGARLTSGARWRHQVQALAPTAAAAATFLASVKA